MLFWRFWQVPVDFLWTPVGLPFLTSDPCQEKGIFLHTNCQLTQYFLFKWQFSVNHRDGCDVLKAPVDQRGCETLININNHVHQSHFNPVSSLFWCRLWPSARLFTICLNGTSCCSMIGSLASFKNILHILLKSVCVHAHLGAKLKFRQACFVRRALTMAKWESLRVLFSLRIKTRQHSPHSIDKNRNSCDRSPGQSTCLCFLVSRSPFIRESRAKNGENRNCGPAACL